MARIRYYYDTESCRYERIRTSKWDIFINSLAFLTVATAIATGLVFGYMMYFESPEELQLRKENQELLMFYNLMNEDMESISQVLQSMKERDDDIYRVIFGVNPLADEIRTGGTGGANKYRALMEKGLSREALIVNDLQKIDDLKKQMYIQTKSYDEIVELAKNKEDFLAALPAIQPVSNEELKRLSSGFGYRIDPYLKTRRMHPGVDFSLEVGNPVHATGNGKVKFTKSSLSGYGKQVHIDHGFSYETKYGHLDKILVKKGQRVKRGDIIGYSGHSGKSTAPHLHYEVIKNGVKVNPIHYFSRDLSAEEYEEILRLASIENQAMGSY
ncbi:MAG: peptidase M23 [Flammeovirgaceae bacterium TMED32]|nr:MAG: peptidase M23 [Flammeovirgaceae bacterium TMED32]|tara:strand:- start:2400 stop:3383 length:984 start_codon:yes stop_codon:yes gene_type:complete